MDVVEHEFINKLGIKTVYPLGIPPKFIPFAYLSILCWLFLQKKRSPAVFGATDRCLKING
jgi:hypothetical protein